MRTDAAYRQEAETKAVVLLSGGIDSATAMAVAQSGGYTVYGLSFRYGQRHMEEINAAKRVAAHLNAAAHNIIDMDMGKIGGSALTDDLAVPKDKREERQSVNNIPVTYVPARNTIFLSFALAWAEVLAADTIFIGVTAVDYSGYPDCREPYIRAFETMANLATRAGVTGETVFKIRTPLIKLSKGEIIQRGLELGVDYSLTLSCYDPYPGGISCGECDACYYRKKGFEEARLADPTVYRK